MDPMTLITLVLIIAIFAVPLAIAWAVFMKVTRFAARSTLKTVNVVTGIPKKFR